MASHATHTKLATFIPAILIFCMFTACAPAQSEEMAEDTNSDLEFDPGTEEDREALFDHLLEITMERDAFASLPEHPLYQEHPKGIDVRAEMEQYRDDLIEADNAKDMWLVLNKLSNARKDRHLSLGTVENGLEVPDELRDSGVAPVRFLVDYEDLDNRFFFISDMGEEINHYTDANANPSLGDKVVSINDMSGEEYIEAIRPYWRYSSENRLWMRVSEIIGHKRSHVPHSEFYRDELELVMERPDGSRYEMNLPYLDSGDIAWQQYEDLDHIDWSRYFTREYPGFTRDPEMDEFETLNLFVSETDKPVVLLQWYGFRGDLPDAMDRLVEYADEQDLLDHDVIVDATRGRGGSNGAYALARLQPEKFRTTKHNLMISDLSEQWVRDWLERWEDDPPEHSRGQSLAYLKEWMQTDAMEAIENDSYYTNDVPFKGVQPHWGDATIYPAEKHFTGDMVVWLSPRGGSHLDQFAAQLKDNDLAHIMGMSTGSFSNSWSSTETLRFPTTDKPIVEYEWSMGHSIRPNGEILQYNTPDPHEYIPQTRDNIFDYYDKLTNRSLEHLGL